MCKDNASAAGHGVAAAAHVDAEDATCGDTPSSFIRSCALLSTHLAACGRDWIRAAGVTANAAPPLDSGDDATPHTPSSASKARRLRPGGPVRARDVVVFGREVGRVLSDGRIVGRAEPFAKVFASSRHVKRAVGATAWAILEDIALDAAIDDRPRRNRSAL